MIVSSFTYFLVNGIWGQWSTFTECSRTCGNGTQTRKRACDSPAPSHGGIPCPGELEETQNCNTNTCPGICNPFLSRNVYKYLEWDRFRSEFMSEFSAQSCGRVNIL